MWLSHFRCAEGVNKTVDNSTDLVDTLQNRGKLGFGKVVEAFCDGDLCFHLGQ